jgi:hypothetical protein
MYPNGATYFRRDYFEKKKLTAPQKAPAKQALYSKINQINLLFPSFSFSFSR